VSGDPQPQGEAPHPPPRSWATTARSAMGQLRERLAFTGRRVQANAADRFAWLSRRKLATWIALALAVVLLLAYPLAAWWAHTIDDDPAYTLDEAQLKPNQSRTVAMMVALINREVEENGWVANNPWFTPTGMFLDNMPNFQAGEIEAIARFAFELQDQIGRTRGSSQIDGDLQRAAGFLQTSPSIWYWGDGNILPQATAEQQYRNAAAALAAYNERLANGQAIFDRRADNLIAALDRIAQDLGSASAAIETHIETNGGFPWDNKVDNVFYKAKGQLYGYYMILRELRRDFDDVIQARDVVNVWNQMMQSFEDAVRLEPWIVVNGAPDSLVWPCHVGTQGFYLLRARTQLREITNVLQK
jgi:hypothetical protein